MIPALDARNIYDVPLQYHEAGLDGEVLRAFGIEDAPPPGARGLDRHHGPDRPLRQRGHHRRRRQICRPARRLQEPARGAWSTAASPTAPRSTSSGSTPSCSSIPKPTSSPSSSRSTASSCRAASGSAAARARSPAVTFAREREIPFFGICLGMQMACIEGARNLAGISEASTTEFGETSEPVVGHDHRMDERGGPAAARRRRRPWRHHAARRLSGGARRQQRGPLDLRRGFDQRAAPPPLRGQHPLSRRARENRPGLLGNVARRAAARDRRAARPSVVHRRPVPSRIEEPPVRAASLVRRLHRGGAEADRGWSNSRRNSRQWLDPLRLRITAT